MEITYINDNSYVNYEIMVVKETKCTLKELLSRKDNTTVAIERNEFSESLFEYSYLNSQYLVMNLSKRKLLYTNNIYLETDVEELITLIG